MKKDSRHNARSTRKVFVGSLVSTVLIAVVIGVSASGVTGQVFVKPKIYKNSAVIKMPDLGISDLNEDLEVNSVFVLISNFGTGNAGPFYVRVWFKPKGSSTKKYVEKRIAGVNAKTDLPVYVNIGQPATGLEIGIFLDARKQVAETNEKENCGRIYPGGGATGVASCENF